MAEDLPPPPPELADDLPPVGAPPSPPAEEDDSASVAGSLASLKLPPPPQEDANNNAAPAPTPAAGGGSTLGSPVANPYYVESDDEDEADPGAAPPPSAPADKPKPERKALPRMQPMDVSEHPELLAEGYLTKVKSSALSSRTRFFRLTAEKLVYYEEHAGKPIASVARDDISSVEDMGKNKFKLNLAVEIGRNKGKNTIVLDAPNQRVKARWMSALRADTSHRPPNHEELICEGSLCKVQPLCTTNMTRWFVCTNKRFGYFKDEAGEKYGEVLLSNIELISSTDDKREFRVYANVPMTKTGFYDVTCRAPNQAIRDKWCAQLQRVFPQHKMSAALQMCCYMD